MFTVNDVNDTPPHLHSQKNAVCGRPRKNPSLLSVLQQPCAAQIYGAVCVCGPHPDCSRQLIAINLSLIHISEPTRPY